MSRVRPSATFTTEFGHEFEAERERLLRRRFLWYTGTMLSLGGLAAAVRLAVLVAAPSRWLHPVEIVGLAFSLLSIGLYAGAMVYVRRVARPRLPLMSLVYWLIVAAGVLTLAGGVAEAELASRTPPRPLNVGVGPQGAPIQVVVADRPAASPAGWQLGFGGAAQIFMTHFLACLFLPWTPRESVRPLIPLRARNALITLAYAGGAWWGSLMTILVSPTIGLPGAGVCWWRTSRLRERFHHRQIARRYGEMRDELRSAREIHEALFPKPWLDGLTRFTYRYEPMRQIGGDYLFASGHARPGCERMLSLVVLDVTGHGIPAALTVNRLHGELERIFAEDPCTPPGEVLRLLNRYVHLTLARHSVYVTALCLRVDPDARTLEYASGGHPPAFLRAVDGRIEELGSTAFVLGAARGEDFDPEARAVAFGPGDTLIAYTDGAVEARDRSGRMFGIAGLRRLIAAGPPVSPGHWPGAILSEVEAFRFGPAADDTLVIEVSVGLRTAAVRPAAPPARSGPAPVSPSHR